MDQDPDLNLDLGSRAHLAAYFQDLYFDGSPSSNSSTSAAARVRGISVSGRLSSPASARALCCLTQAASRA